jgi:hypothetical protein
VSLGLADPDPPHLHPPAQEPGVAPEREGQDLDGVVGAYLDEDDAAEDGDRGGGGQGRTRGHVP